ncbi:hypothetical protein EMCRGX_G014125, partial [Ephydatia muelleri]
ELEIMTELSVTSKPSLALPNLPKAVVPHIEFSSSKTDEIIQLRPSLASQRKIGFLLSDQSAQTDRTDILDVKQVTQVLWVLIQDTVQLKKDIAFTKNALKASYETKLEERANELYCHAKERVQVLEQQFQEKLELIRLSTRAQLSNAIQQISGEYKIYYEQMLLGKAGKQESKLKELKEKVQQLEQQLFEKDEIMKTMEEKLQQQEGLEKIKAPPPEAPPPGISLEEAHALQSEIERLEDEGTELRSQLAAREETNKKLTQQANTLGRQLEDEKGKVAQLLRDLESCKSKAKSEQEKAAKMAASQLAALEQEMKEKMAVSVKEATQKAEQQAEAQRTRDMAKHQEAIQKQKQLENELRAKQQEKPVIEGDLAAVIDKLQKKEAFQSAEITRLTKELDRCNKMWELKLTILQRNFHSLQDECFTRYNLQRQSALLHHATVGYSSGPVRGNPRPQFAHATDSSWATVDSPSLVSSRIGTGAAALPNTPAT